MHTNIQGKSLLARARPPGPLPPARGSHKAFPASRQERRDGTMPATAKTLLVLSADAKGVVMRPGALRPATAKAAARRGKMRTRLAAGEKPNRNRMATLACVYDAEPAAAPQDPP